jgi:glycosyltransferase involved in cell wall biosynthesis
VEIAVKSTDSATSASRGPDSDEHDTAVTGVQPLHVCYLCSEYPPCTRTGGIGIFVQTLARAMVAAGHRATVVGLYDQPTERKEDWDAGVRVIRRSARGRLFKLGWLINRRSLHRELSDLVAAEAVDLVEAPDYEGLFWMAPDWGVPRAVRIHGGETYFRRLLNEPLRWRHFVAERAGLRRANAYASVSRYAWEGTRRVFGLPDVPVSILPNPVDCSRFRPGDVGEVVPGRIVNTGTVIRKKGILELFAALPEVFATIPNAHLWCVGPDSSDRQTGADSTAALARSLLPLAHQSRVTFTGAIPHEEIARLVRTAQVCAYPSLLENHPIAWIEAMASGKPIVASSTGSGPEVIEDGVSGLLCDPRDTTRLANVLVSLLLDGALAARLGSGARRQALERYSLDVMIPANLAWYGRVLEDWSHRRDRTVRARRAFAPFAGR